ncbi:Hypothetical protein D9617_23g005040 [Elsinoe fawcettii]|nr:Hypothetical protein D9617_23g005040 [Elsinoe fawcettii]
MPPYSSRRAIEEDSAQLGIICALDIELAAIRSMFDEEYEDSKDQDISDKNAYTLGRIAAVDIVVAVLPAGQYGKVSAAVVANRMITTFTAVKAGLMVGIGGVIPHPTLDIRLGDVVVSQPSGMVGGVVQYDLGRRLADGSFERAGHLNAPPRELLTALSKLKAAHVRDGHGYLLFLRDAMQSTLHQGRAWDRPSQDRLFKASYGHPDGNLTCSECTPSEEIERTPIHRTEPRVHYGIVASGDSVIRNTEERDRIGSDVGALCFEMESAGLMQDFPCLVIRGMSDYSDSHKNKEWQAYASLTAAAFAKEFIGYLPRACTQQMQSAASLLDAGTGGTNQRYSNLLQSLEANTMGQDKAPLDYEQRRHTKLLASLKTSKYEDMKAIIPQRAPGTCQWVFGNPTYIDWLEDDDNSLLWISANPGCGKTVLAKAAVDHELPKSFGSQRALIYHFFFRDNAGQNSAFAAFTALIHQILTEHSTLIK